MLCKAFFLLSELAFIEALNRNLSAVSMANLWFSWPLTYSSRIKVISPTTSSIRACCFSSCLSCHFVTTGSLPLRTVKIGQAVAVVFGVPYLSHHWHLILFSAATEKVF